MNCNGNEAVRVARERTKAVTDLAETRAKELCQEIRAGTFAGTDADLTLLGAAMSVAGWNPQDLTDAIVGPVIAEQAGAIRAAELASMIDRTRPVVFEEEMGDDGIERLKELVDG